MQCEHIYKNGAKKGTRCTVIPKEGTLCGKHKPNVIEEQKEAAIKHREDNHEAYLKDQRVYMVNKRNDPTYKEKERQYQLEYCKKKGITMQQLWNDIRAKKGLPPFEARAAIERQPIPRAADLAPADALPAVAEVAL